nr:hypothetical protein Iba_scaffold12116CG0130 [Ipomoea batatas]
MNSRTWPGDERRFERVEETKVGIISLPTIIFSAIFLSFSLQPDLLHISMLRMLASAAIHEAMVVGLVDLAAEDMVVADMEVVAAMAVKVGMVAVGILVVKVAN